MVLAVVGPILLYQAFQSRKELYLLEASLRKDLNLERNHVIAQVTLSFFQRPGLMEKAILERELPKGAITGLKGFMDANEFQETCNLQIGSGSNCPSQLLHLLWQDDLFFSGMPKKYAGLVEILNQDDLILSQSDFSRLYDVMYQFWYGEELNDEDYRFLLHRLPEVLMPKFTQQLALMGIRPIEESSAFLASFPLQGHRYLLRLEEKHRQELNQILNAFDLGILLDTSPKWISLGNIQTNLKIESRPVSVPLRRNAFISVLTCIVFETVLALIFWVLHKYETLSNTQRKLLATTSHELRTPLAVIRQFSEMLTDRGSRFDQRYQAWHTHIYKESMRMQVLIENLLSAARYERLEFSPNPQTFLLDQWLAEVIESVGQLSDKPIEVQCEALEVHWDPTLMQQVLVNLIENARIHAGSEVTVTGMKLKQNTCLIVRDFGADVAMKQFRRIKAFRSGNRSNSGLGLGLFLVDRIVNAHGGTITFEAANPGLSVRISIPSKG